MNTVMNYESIFERYGGIMRTCELTREGISYQVLQNLIEQGRVEKIKYGYYQWQDEKALCHNLFFRLFFTHSLPQSLHFHQALRFGNIRAATGKAVVGKE